MEYIYFKSSKGNFGDDLNAWLWPQLFNDIPTSFDGFFLGIGSILHADNHEFGKIEKAKKIVFGTGVRPSSKYKPFNIDSTWDIKFLRGPLSAHALKGNFTYISDAAYALRSLHSVRNLVNIPKKYNISLMPYFHSLKYFDWKKICDDLGFHYISPACENGVEHTLQEIAASRFLITEAMHGAIVADLLRVPWHRFVFSTPYSEGALVSEFKWNDWLSSIDQSLDNITYIKLFTKYKLNYWISNLTGNMISSEFFNKKTVRNSLLQQLSKIDTYSLSNDLKISLLDERLEEQIQNFRFEYKNQ